MTASARSAAARAARAAAVASRAAAAADAERSKSSGAWRPACAAAASTASHARRTAAATSPLLSHAIAAIRQPCAAIHPSMPPPLKAWESCAAAIDQMNATSPSDAFCAGIAASVQAQVEDPHALQTVCPAVHAGWLTYAESTTCATLFATHAALCELARRAFG